MSNKMWDALLEHAQTCVLSGKLYVYYPEDSRNVGVVFNNIYELNGLITGEQYISADSLSDNQKVGLICVLLLITFHIYLLCSVMLTSSYTSQSLIYLFCVMVLCLLLCFSSSQN